MSDVSTNRPALPRGWYYPTDVAEAQSLHTELQRELPPGHLLFGQPVETFAFRRDCDDVLFRYQNGPERFTVVHLTWTFKRETAEHPSVCFDGTFEGFLEHEKWRS